MMGLLHRVSWFIRILVCRTSCIGRDTESPTPRFTTQLVSERESKARGDNSWGFILAPANTES